MAEERTFEIASLREAPGLQEFVDFWEARYSNEGGEKFYWNEAQWPVGGDGDAVWEHFENLLRWKEQARFRENAVESVQRRRDELFAYMEALQATEGWSEERVVEAIQNSRAALGASDDTIVRPVLACHYARPEQFPLYDQHVWRAWGRIEGWLEREHLDLRPTTADSYAQYREFALGLAKELGSGSREDLRRIDKALMAFGEFLMGEGDRLWSEEQVGEDLWSRHRRLKKTTTSARSAAIG